MKDGDDGDEEDRYEDAEGHEEIWKGRRKEIWSALAVSVFSVVSALSSA